MAGPVPSKHQMRVRFPFLALDTGVNYAICSPIMKSLVITFAIIVIAGLSLPAPNLNSAIATVNANTPLVTTAYHNTPTPSGTRQNRAWFVEATLPVR